MRHHEPAMLTDSHAHLDMPEFDKDRAAVIKSAVKSGLMHVLTVGIDLESSCNAVSLARKYDPVYASVGYHPHNADDCDPNHLHQLIGLANETKVVAWGEIGLDFFRHYASTDGQLAVFRRQMGIARDLGLPVIIHDREAHDDILNILREFGKGHHRGVIHCFSGDVDLATALIELGYFISIPGTVTYKKAVLIKEVASAIPLDRMLIETDSPFLAPVPKRGKRNEPSYVVYTAEEIARLRNMNVETIALKTTENAKALFGLP